jgi:glucosamine--fructose-6-phosphate aminotransferase (isomerizing)
MTPLMMREAREAPDAVAAFLRDGAGEVEALAAAVRAAAPPFALTVARGSSDHASAYGRYLFETRLGLVTASAAPSTVTVYGARPRVAGALALGVSQSGQSPDLLRTMEAAAAGGALTAAFVNAPDAPLAGLVRHPVFLRAHPERAVAATKSVVATLVAFARLTGAVAGDADLLSALDRFPDALRGALDADVEGAAAALADADDLVVIGRGPAFAVALETALKLKETCGLHAEAFSAAEFLHGPMAIAGAGFPVVVLAPEDAALPGVLAVAGRLKAAGVRLVVLSSARAALDLADVPVRLPPALHPLLDPVAALGAVHRLAAALAAARGLDPDAPRHLAKVTRTE